MRAFPSNRREWLAFLFFSFKAYVVTAPVFFFVWDAVRSGHGNFHGDIRADFAAGIAAGYLICLLFFIIATLVQFIGHRRDAALASFLFVVAIIVILYFWLPMLNTA
jgi:hypothetical protein